MVFAHNKSYKAEKNVFRYEHKMGRVAYKTQTTKITAFILAYSRKTDRQT